MDKTIKARTVIAWIVVLAVFCLGLYCGQSIGKENAIDQARAEQELLAKYGVTTSIAVNNGTKEGGSKK